MRPAPRGGIKRGARLAQDRNHGIEALRCVAALLVAGFHLWSAATPGGAAHAALGPVFAHGESGVDIFFVISGAVMTLSASRAASFGIGGFMRNRFVRIYPVYWVCLAGIMAVQVAAAAAGFGDAPGGLTDPLTVTTSLLLLPLPHFLIGVAWTLSVEMLFYIVFAVSYAFAGLRGAVVAVVIWHLAARLSAPYVAGGELVFLLHAIVLEFAFGILIGWALLKGATPFAAPAAVLGAAAMAATIALADHAMIEAYGRELVYGLPAALLVYGFAATRMRLPRWVLLGGESSYLLYLTHNFFIGSSALAMGVALGLDPRSQLGPALLQLVGAVIFAAVLTVLVERPLLGALRARLRRRKAAAAAG